MELAIEITPDYHGSIAIIEKLRTLMKRLKIYFLVILDLSSQKLVQ